MTMSLENIFMMIHIEKRRGIQYSIIIILVFIITHFMAINYVEVEKSASFYPPYIEKRVVYPELYENKKNN